MGHSVAGWLGGVVTIEKSDGTLGQFWFFLNMFCTLLLVLRCYSICLFFYSVNNKWLWLLDSLVGLVYPHVPYKVCLTDSHRWIPSLGHFYLVFRRCSPIITMSFLNIWI